MRNTTYTAAIISVALFSGATFAEVDNRDDIIYGTGTVTPSLASPYVRVNSGPADQDSDLLSNLGQLRSSSQSVPFDKLSDDRDNRDSLRDNIS